jgi:hypothetical protein
MQVTTLRTINSAGLPPVFAPHALRPSVFGHMHHKPPFDPSLIALNISGDMGGMTFYVNKNRKTVAYPAAPALRPASPLQRPVRARFACAMRHWKLLLPDQRRNYSAVCDYLSLCMWGANLFSYLALTDPGILWQTIRKQCGYPLVQPPDFTEGNMALPSPEAAEVQAWILQHYGS